MYNQSTNQPINQSTNQPINQSTNQPINQSTNQPINQSTNQPINQSTNQPINQPHSPISLLPLNELTNIKTPEKLTALSDGLLVCDFIFGMQGMFVFEK
ncbi:PT domain-containing protein [Rodentibacter heidelbergensis]|uniref:Uncharacterized protein n=1 Tax=Rodentibacter heidelbergensis TaxID=1908258 RepID=A0A1V3ICP3_9PAST|nr:PT domain-containing protein [Rodentibacter heidelbergensis]OOF37705.1 hypothetical protein BKK48_00250 [Rodentibacter heidelbergensis]